MEEAAVGSHWLELHTHMIHVFEKNAQQSELIGNEGFALLKSSTEMLADVSNDSFDHSSATCKLKMIGSTENVVPSSIVLSDAEVLVSTSAFCTGCVLQNDVCCCCKWRPDGHFATIAVNLKLMLRSGHSFAPCKLKMIGSAAENAVPNSIVMSDAEVLLSTSAFCTGRVLQNDVCCCKMRPKGYFATIINLKSHIKKCIGQEVYRLDLLVNLFLTVQLCRRVWCFLVAFCGAKIIIYEEAELLCITPLLLRFQRPKDYFPTIRHVLPELSLTNWSIV